MSWCDDDEKVSGKIVTAVAVMQDAPSFPSTMEPWSMAAMILSVPALYKLVFNGDVLPSAHGYSLIPSYVRY